MSAPLVLLVSALAFSDSARVPAGLGVPSIPIAHLNGVPVVAANDLARLLGASRSWRSDVRKLVLRVGEHHLTFTDENPFVLADDQVIRLEHPVRMRAGELQIPVEIAHLLPGATQAEPAPGGWPRLARDDVTHQMRAGPAAGFIGAPRVVVRGGITALVIPVERAGAAGVTSRSRARFRLRVPGGLAGAMPDSLPSDGLLRHVAVSVGPGDITFELAVDPAATGWQLDRDPAARRVTLAFARDAGGFADFAAEGAAGPRALHTVVLDPGHGGADHGVEVGATDEKTLALELAGAVADEIRRRSAVRVVLTRSDDRDLPQETRAETANRARADAVLSLHFGAFPDAGSSSHRVAVRGVVAWCPAAAVPAEGSAGSGEIEAEPGLAAGLPALVAWRDAALRRAVESRGLAESVTAALVRHGFGPASVRERLPYVLIGVQSPGVLLECGSLSNPEERARLLAPDGIRDLAAAIASGVLAWQRNE